MVIETRIEKAGVHEMMRSQEDEVAREAVDEIGAEIARGRQEVEVAVRDVRGIRSVIGAEAATRRGKDVVKGAGAETVTVTVTGRGRGAEVVAPEEIRGGNECHDFGRSTLFAKLGTWYGSLVLDF
jgi:hypothetical protein